MNKQELREEVKKAVSIEGVKYEDIYKARDQIMSLISEYEEELIDKYRPTLQMVYVTAWLHNYGITDDDQLNAGEIEELLEVFVQEHWNDDLTNKVEEK